MSNLTDCGSLSVLFSDPAVGAVTSLTGSSVVVQSAPTAVALGTWIALEALATGLVAPRSFVRLSTGVAVLASLANALVLVRFFDLLRCDGETGIADWQVPGVALSTAASILLLLLATRLPRLAVLTAVGVAGGTVAADWACRGGAISPTPAAESLVAVQQLWALQAVALCAFVRLGRGRGRGRGRGSVVPRREGVGGGRGEAKGTNASPFGVVDALARREDGRERGSPARGKDRSWSWFL